MSNILIVDDEVGIQESLSGVLEDEGYTASVAASGEACLDLLQKQTFDVVLLDIWLPGMDGLETLRKIRELSDGPEVIMISGHGTIADAVEATRAGAFDFLEKPLSRDRVLLAVKNALEQSTLRQENERLRGHTRKLLTLLKSHVIIKSRKEKTS